MKWEKVKLGDCCTVTSSKRFLASERSKFGIPFFGSKEIIKKTNGEDITECDYITKEAYENIKKRYGVPVAGDLLITTRGSSYGVPYIYKVDDCFYFADGNLTWLKNFTEFLLPSYLYWWIKSYEGQKKIDAIAKGTAQKAVSIESIKMIELNLPPLLMQQRIASILSAYDDIIENNQKQIKLLEEAAQRLYKEWFVDLRFPGHESVKVVDGVPEGWKRTNIGDLVAYDIGGGWGEDCITGKCEKAAFVIRGTDIYGITHGEISSIPYRYHSETNLESRQLVDGDIIFEVSGGSKTEGVAKTVLIKSALLSFFNAPIMCASFCKLVRLENVKLSQFMYDTFQYLRLSGKTTEFDKKSASSIVNYRWKDFLAQQEILCPDFKILGKYNELAERYYLTIVNHSILVEKLREARDRLLPKLMSGEIEVADTLNHRYAMPPDEISLF